MSETTTVTPIAELIDDYFAMWNETDKGFRPIGALLREWRERRRMSQLDLALDAEIATRHLSFVRIRPSR